MKKVLYVVLGVIVLLFAALASIPLFFKDSIKAKIDSEIANAVNAKVYYNANDFGLSIFSSFPNLTVSMGNFGVVGQDTFAHDTLAAVKSFNAVVDIMSVIGGDKIKVKEISLIEPKIRVIVLANGKANWDISKPSATPTDTAKSEPSSFNIGIDKWSIKDGNICYTDLTIPLKAEVLGLNHTGKGDFTQDIFDLNMQTVINSLSVTFDKVNYLSNKKLEADMTLNMDLPNAKYTFKENNFKLNEFAFGFDGYVAMPAAGIETDIKFKTLETKFKSILSLVPGVYMADFADIKTDGTLAFDGYAKGLYNEKQMPAFGLNLKIDKGMFQYPKLPTAVTNIALDMAVKNSKGIIDETEVNISKFHLDLGKNPVDARLTLKGLTNMLLDADVSAKLNLAEITNVFPVDGLTLKGLFGLNVKAKGTYNDSLHLLPAVTANMNMIDGFVKSKDFPAPIEKINFMASVENPNGQMEATKIQVPTFGMELEGEPFSMVAFVENLVDYQYDVKVKGGVDLTKITKIYPLEGMTLAGKIKADIATRGRMSDVTAKRYAKLPTSGTLTASNFSFVSKDVPQGVKITGAAMSFDPVRAQVSKFEGFLGKSDVSANGYLSNYLAFIFNNEKLTGALNFSSKKFDTNEWLTKEEVATKTTAEEPMTVVEIPKNIDFVLASQLGEVLYDNMDITDLKGNIIVRDGTVRLDKGTFNLLGGAFGMNGLYDSRDLTHPKFDFDLDIKNLEIPKAYQTFNTVKMLAPVAENMTGKLSTKFKINGELGKDMMPVYPTMNGAGLLNIAEASLKEMKLLSGIQKVTKLSGSNSGAVNLKDLLLKAEIQNGRVFFQPFDVSAGGQKINIGGSQGFDGTIDYNIKMTVPAGAAGVALNNATSLLTGKAADGSGNVKLNLKATGNQNDPKISLLGGGSDGSSSLKSDVKANVQASLNDAKAKAQATADSLRKAAEDKAKAELDKAKADAEAKAKEEADRLKKEAEEKAKKELEKLKDKWKLPKK
ncbi:AsmA family protein [Flexibacter flexilis DSM 6793]|uniref:AsmA family protein n=1 Tax=Flexibacter flexilis DSM 6793 TaxID=927664 RepID=A0A1I1FNJ2_9BACT|nr:AsmA-like C-terminal region-containing protein [Flexibacter flexilis]SFC00885.1 AsmA family protein [Flexibacter flexilis DSM 6793]